MVGMTMISSSIFELAIDATIVVGFDLINMIFSQFEYCGILGFKPYQQDVSLFISNSIL